MVDGWWLDWLVVGGWWLVVIGKEWEKAGAISLVGSGPIKKTRTTYSLTYSNYSICSICY